MYRKSKIFERVKRKIFIQLQRKSVNKNNFAERRDLEGDYWETENGYTILMYYKSFTDRADQLIGIGKINSRTDKPGISF